MKEIDFNEYQNQVLKVYEKTSKIFDNSGIKFWAHSGTLLGIVRHDNDFIPWDDDIDIMVSLKDWDKKREEVIEKSTKDFLYCIDYLYDDKGIVSPIKYVKFFSMEKFLVVDGQNQTIARPFIDVFFVIPANTFKYNLSWWWYQSMWRSYWISFAGFKRYQKGGSKTKVLFKNLFTYPLKIFFTKKRMDNFLIGNMVKFDGDWNRLRRADAWAARDIIYNKSQSFKKRKIRENEILVNPNYLDELEKSFGKNWMNEKKSLPHIFNSKHKKVTRNIKTNEYLNSLEEKSSEK